jgi:hypothetical protein
MQNLAARDEAMAAVAKAAALPYWTSLQNFTADFPDSPWPPNHPFYTPIMASSASVSHVFNDW